MKKSIIFLSLISLTITLTLTSPDIDPLKEIPLEFTPFGKNINPSFKWSNIPKETKSLAFSVEDPDAPKGLFCHWILINIDKNINEINQNSFVGKPVKNNFGLYKYSGPNPPKGQIHNYHFVIYALNEQFIDVKGCKDFKTKMEQVSIQKSEIVAKFKSRKGTNVEDEQKRKKKEERKKKKEKKKEMKEKIKQKKREMKINDL